MYRSPLALIGSLTLIAGLFVGAPAKVHAVDPVYLGPGGGSGSCASPDYITDGTDDSDLFQTAVNDQDGDIDNILYVCPGTYDMSAEVLISSDLTIIGVGGATSTVLDATNSTTRIFQFDGVAVVEGLTFINADSAGSGGAIYIDYDLTVRDSVFEDNIASEGGAIYQSDGDYPLIITGSTFINNTADGGDGGAVATNYDLDSVIDSTFIGNTASDDGGAIYVDDEGDDVNGDGVAGIFDSVFRDNSAGGDGGAIYFDEDTESVFEISGNLFIGNEADSDGGAINLDEDQDGPLTNNRFIGNVSEDDGGAVYVEDWASTITGNLFKSNESGSDGGGLYLSDTVNDSYIYRNTFQENYAEFKGGGMYIDDTGEPDDEYMTISKNVFRNNVAGTDGGGMFLSFDNTELAPRSVRGNRFIKNRADGLGGGVHFLSCSVPLGSLRQNTYFLNRGFMGTSKIGTSVGCEEL